MISYLEIKWNRFSLMNNLMDNLKNYILKEHFKKYATIADVVSMVNAGILNAEQGKEILFDITPMSTPTVPLEATGNFEKISGNMYKGIN